MKTITSIVEEIIMSKPFLQDFLVQDLLHYKNLALSIQKEVNTIANKEIRVQTIIISLRRIRKNLVKEHKSEIKFDDETDLSIKSNICEIVLEKTNRVEKKLKNLEIKQNRNDIYSINMGLNQINLVVSKKHKNKILNLFEKDEILSIFDNLEGIIVSFSIETFERPGLFYILTRSLFWKDISIVEIISTMTELIIIVKESDVTRAYDSIKKTIKENS